MFGTPTAAWTQLVDEHRGQQPEPCRHYCIQCCPQRSMDREAGMESFHGVRHLLMGRCGSLPLRQVVSRSGLRAGGVKVRLDIWARLYASFRKSLKTVVSWPDPAFNGKVQPCSTLPDAIVALLDPWATLFTSPTWRKAQLLLDGAFLAPGLRTVAVVALRVDGPQRPVRLLPATSEVLNRAVWSSRQAARIAAGAVAGAPGCWQRCRTHLRHGRDPAERRRVRQDQCAGHLPATRCVPAGLRWSRPSACAWIRT